MTLAQGVMLGFAVLMGLGGFMGYRAGSLPSLVAGMLSGAAMLGAYLLSNSTMKGGLLLGVAISLLLSFVFSMRLSKTKKFMPSGLLLGVATVTLLVLGYAALQSW